jgi:hypothetical protein
VSGNDKRQPPYRAGFGPIMQFYQSGDFAT